MPDDQQASPVSPFQFTQDNAGQLDVTWKWNNKSPTINNDVQPMRPRQLPRRHLRPKLEENRYVPPEKKQLRGFHKFHKELLAIQEKQNSVIKSYDEISFGDESFLNESKPTSSLIDEAIINRDNLRNNTNQELNIPVKNVTCDTNMDLEMVQDSLSDTLIDNIFSDLNTSELEKNALNIQHHLSKIENSKSLQNQLVAANVKDINEIQKSEDVNCERIGFTNTHKVNYQLPKTSFSGEKTKLPSIVESQKQQIKPTSSRNFLRKEVSGISNQQQKNSFQPKEPINLFKEINMPYKSETITKPKLETQQKPIITADIKLDNQITPIKNQESEPFDSCDEFLMSIPLEAIVSEALSQHNLPNHSQIILETIVEPGKSNALAKVQPPVSTFQSQRPEFSRNKSSTQLSTRVEPVAKAFQRYKSSGSFDMSNKKDSKNISVSNNITRVQSDSSLLSKLILY